MSSDAQGLLFECCLVAAFFLWSLYMARFWWLARCQQAVWAYQDWREGGPLPSGADALFGLLSRSIGPVLRD